MLHYKLGSKPKSMSLTVTDSTVINQLNILAELKQKGLLSEGDHNTMVDILTDNRKERLIAAINLLNIKDSTDSELTKTCNQMCKIIK